MFQVLPSTTKVLSTMHPTWCMVYSVSCILYTTPMTIDLSIFKTYDVRGIYPNQLTPEIFCDIGQALAKLFSKIAKTEPTYLTVAVGRDMRLGSETLQEALMGGLRECGVQIHDIGLVPIDLVYFAVGELNYDGAVMITASHNPAEYNGCKAVGKNMTWIGGTGIGNTVRSLNKVATANYGSLTSVDLYPRYLANLKKAIDVNTNRPLRVVVDAGNGMAGKVIPLLQPMFPTVKIDLLFGELDGRFPNRPSNPLLPNAAAAASKRIWTTKADAGFMFDGDTDRIFLLDEHGRLIRGDQTLLLLAKEALRKEPGTAIAYNLICSRAVPELIKKWNGVPIRTPVGYVNVSAGLKKYKGRLSGEVSSHFSFRENNYADSGFLAFIYALNLLSREERPLSLLVDQITLYTRGDEVNLEHPNIPLAIKTLREKYSDGDQDDVDGLTVQYKDWWFNARPSNTEPLLRIVVEANTPEEQKKREQGVIDIVKSTLK